MNTSLKKIIRLILLAVHFISGGITLALYLLNLKKPGFIDSALPVLLSWSGSSVLIYALYRKTLQSWKKEYFKALCYLTLFSIGIWIVLGVVMMH